MTGGDGGSDSGDTIKYTSDQVAQQNVNAKLWNYYQTDYKPVVDKFVGRKTDPTIVKQEEDQMKGKVNAEVVKNIDPTKLSNNAVENMRKLNAAGKVAASGEVKGEQQIRSRKLSGEQNLVDIGQGQATTAAKGINELASQSLEKEMANVELEEKVGMVQDNAMGSMVGAGAAGLYRALSSGSSTPKTTGLDKL